MKAADGLNLSEGKWKSRVRVPEVEVVGTPRFRIAVLVAFGGQGEQRVGLVVHEVASHLVGPVCEAGGMFIVGGGKQNDRRIDGAGAYGEQARRVDGRIAAIGSRWRISPGAGVNHFHAGNSRAGAVRQQARNAGVCHQGDVGQMHNLPDAVDIGVGFGVNQAGIAVACIAANALRRDRVRFVALQAQRHRKGVNAKLADSVLNRLHARFVADWGERILLRMEGFGGIERRAESTRNRRRCSEIAMHVEEFFGAGVIRLHIGVGDGPLRGDAAFVLDQAEIFGAHAKHRGAVNLGLSSHAIDLLRVEVPTLLVLPGLFGVVTVM